MRPTHCAERMNRRAKAAGQGARLSGKESHLLIRLLVPASRLVRD
jgi:hypothetical protein